MMITTIYGDIDESLLEKKVYVDKDDENEYTTATEYWLNGELVHRSAHVTLKKMPAMFGKQGEF